MRPTLPSRRGLGGLLLATVLALTAGTLALAAGGPELTRDRALRVLTPQDGSDVGADFLLSWSAGRPSRFAVVIDAALPAPGALVKPGENVLTLDGTALRLTLGPRSGGSPSARRHHEVVVVPLDQDGRRIGEQTAVVRVRTRP